MPFLLMYEAEKTTVLHTCDGATCMYLAGSTDTGWTPDKSGDKFDDFESSSLVVASEDFRGGVTLHIFVRYRGNAYRAGHG